MHWRDSTAEVNQRERADAGGKALTKLLDEELGGERHSNLGQKQL